MRSASVRRGSTWSPLLEPAFRALWIASVVSNLGTWMQNVGVAWLMTTLTPSPLLVALIQTATSVPVLLIGLPAGALADLVDRRRLLLVTQTWMLVAALALGGLTLADRTTPVVLLVLTFALGLGGAANSPAWQAIIPELVPRPRLAAAVALNGAGFNAARAIGPAVGGLLVAATGPGVVFVLNALSFLATLLVLYRWRRVPRQRSGPAEHLVEALSAGLRYVRFAPVLQALLGRSAIFVLCASALWALLPVVARQRLGLDSSGYGLLLACLGSGAVSGAFVLPRVRELLTLDWLVATASVCFGLGTFALGWSDSLPVVALALALAGLAWLLVMSSFNLAAQTVAPAWVSARVIGTYLLVSQGGLAIGSLLWGVVADRLTISVALTLAGAGLAAGLVAAPFWRLTRAERLDLRPSPLTATLPDAQEVVGSRGPVLVTVEYQVAAINRAAFVLVMHELRTVRRRDGAQRWGLFHDPSEPTAYVETFVIGSWDEHLRQHHRATMADQAIQRRVRDLAQEPPRVRHLLAAEL